MSRIIELISPHSADACVAKLNKAMDVGTGPDVLGSKPVIGGIDGRSVWLRKRIPYRNRFQTVLRGTLEDHANGSRFRGRAGINWVTRIFTAIWLAGVLLLAIWVCIVFLWRGGNLGGLLMAPLLFGIGTGIAWFGRWQARDEERFLTAFLIDEICEPTENSINDTTAQDPLAR